jgi:hypothetical protein
MPHSIRLAHLSWEKIRQMGDARSAKQKLLLSRQKLRTKWVTTTTIPLLLVSAGEKDASEGSERVSLWRRMFGG